jgi:hypothetical protein
MKRADGFDFGAKVWYRLRLSDGDTAMKCGYILMVEGAKATVVAPPVEGSSAETCFDLKDTTGAEKMKGCFDVVDTEHLLTIAASQGFDFSSERVLAFVSAPDLRAAAGRFFAGDATVSSDSAGGSLPLRRARLRETANPSSSSAFQAAGLAGLAAMQGLWGATPGAAKDGESDSDSSEDGGAAKGGRLDPKAAGDRGQAANFWPPQASLGAAGLPPPPSQWGRPSGSGGLAGAAAATTWPHPGAPWNASSAATCGAGAAGPPWGLGPMGAGAASGFAMPGPPAFGSDPMVMMQYMWQAEMVKAMRKLARGRGGDSDGSDSDETGGMTSGKAFKGVHRLRRKFERAPEKLLKDFVTRVQLDLGISNQAQYWTLMDHSRKVRGQFKQMHGLYRCHIASAEALQHWLEGRPQHMATYVCLLMQTLHQVALDGGSWDNAVLMLPSPDPLGHPDFGGSQSMMTDVAAYRRGMKELKRQHGGYGRKSEEPEKTEGEAAAPRRGGPKKK